MGASVGVVLARGVKMIVPVSLEKFIPYPIMDIVPRLGNERFSAAMNLPVGIMPMPGEIITEVEAINLLFGCECIPIGGGGVNGREGSRYYLVEGDREAAKSAWEAITKMKGEAPLCVEVEGCEDCKIGCEKGWKDVA